MLKFIVNVVAWFFLGGCCSLYAQTAEVTFDLESLSLSSEATSQFLILPVPLKTIKSQSLLELFSNNKVISANYFIVNQWPSLASTDYVRVLLIELPIPAGFYQTLTLRWQNDALSSKQLKSNISFFTKERFVLRDAELIYPQISWLTSAMLLHPKQRGLEVDWYIEPQKKYANYVTDKELLTKKGYPQSKPSQWLYDRPQAIYQLFLMTGQRKWLKKANEQAEVYISYIDETGKFKLKKQFDPKYLMPKGLLYRYLLSGDNEAKEVLKKIFERSLDWDENYNLARGFWTERNQAAALNVAISYWEVTSDDRALQRINSIIEATVAMTFSPDNDWQLRGCPQHGFKSHEGWGDQSPACSPWMMALLGDALWRFYILTGDKRAASLIDAFGDFVLNYGIYYGDKRVKNIVIPKYIVSIDNAKQEELNQWTDPQHACDVGALLGKSIYIKRQSNQDSFIVEVLFSSLVEQCSSGYSKWLKEQKSKQPKEYWEIKPPRRFAWMYSTTSDLPWLAHFILGQNLEKY